jgi:hypothetical protein
MALPVAALGAALGIGQAISGIIGGNSAAEEAKRLEASRPKYKISPYVNQAVDLAESELASGMSADTRRSYEEGNDRALASSVDAILKGGGSVNNIADVFDASVQGRSRLAQLQEQMRMQQINNVNRAWSNAQEEQAKAFEFNEFRPWADRAQANAQSRQNANANLWGGINTLGSAGAGYLGQLQQQQNYDRYFRTPERAWSPMNNPGIVGTYQPLNTNSGMVAPNSVFNGRPISF